MWRKFKKFEQITDPLEKKARVYALPPITGEKERQQTRRFLTNTRKKQVKKLRSRLVLRSRLWLLYRNRLLLLCRNILRLLCRNNNCLARLHRNHNRLARLYRNHDCLTRLHRDHNRPTLLNGGCLTLVICGLRSRLVHASIKHGTVLTTHEAGGLEFLVPHKLGLRRQNAVYRVFKISVHHPLGTTANDIDTVAISIVVIPRRISHVQTGAVRKPIHRAAPLTVFIPSA